MKEKDTKSNKSCWYAIAVFIGGVMLIASPFNPFYEKKYIGEEEYLTNSSWLITVLLLGALIWFIVKRFGDEGK